MKRNECFFHGVSVGNHIHSGLVIGLQVQLEEFCSAQDSVAFLLIFLGVPRPCDAGIDR
jgi:hypothetical protein